MQFQNTIAYGTFFNAGGIFNLVADTWTIFPFAPESKLSKNTNAYTTASEFRVQVQETGMYFIEFSFVAEDGDGKTYFIRPYVNGSVYNNVGEGMTIKFFQQQTEQKYEVSTHGLFALTKDDIVEWRLSTPVLSSLDLYANSIKMNIINLQQIGVH